jgi:DNA helicase-2/ATP-dependent DNA helicase PcrA
LDRKVGFVARLLGRSGVKGESSTIALDVTGEIEWAKARKIRAADYPSEAARAGRRPPVDGHRIAQAYADYEENKTARRMVDFDDLLRLATRDLLADEQYAAARRWTFRHLFVDEFQDVNPLQFDLLQAWRGDGDSTDLCLVGDPNQAIYSWNGADAGYLVDAATWLPGAETVELTDNYRSSPQILGVANTVLGSNIGPGRPGPRRLLLRPNRGDGPIPAIIEYPDETAEARGIARRARDAHGPGDRWADQAVLVRTNAQLAVIDEAFQSAGIPTRSRGGGRLLDQPEVKDALRTMRADNGILAERLAALEESLGRSSMADDRIANVAEIVRLGSEYLGLDPQGEAGGFHAWLISTLRADDGASGGDAVDLLTFHAAKGLEWDVVHLAGMEDGLVPIHYAQTPEAQDEERRLLYVALTRAERVLTCSRAERRAFGSRSVKRRPSPFLEAVELALDLLSEGHGPIDLSDAVTAQRRIMNSTAGTSPARTARPRNTDTVDLTLEDQHLFDSLKAWRRAQSRLADVPAYVIFNDATLTEVARRRPVSRAALMAVPGIGAVKAERFGEQVLEIVRDTA